MNVVRQLKIPDVLTLGNFICGLLAIFLAILNNFTASAMFIIFAVLFDFLDGKVARYLKQSSELGKQLDSFSDLVSFGIWPSIFGFQMGLNGPIAISVLLLFSLCGMLRLARFNVSNIKHFEGVPITTNGILFPVVYFASQSAHYEWNSYVLILYMIMSILMVSTFRIKKI